LLSRVLLCSCRRCGECHDQCDGCFTHLRFSFVRSLMEKTRSARSFRKTN
jgi:hypothetical protein